MLLWFWGSSHKNAFFASNFNSHIKKLEDLLLVTADSEDLTAPHKLRLADGDKPVSPCTFCLCFACTFASLTSCTCGDSARLLHHFQYASMAKQSPDHHQHTPSTPPYHAKHASAPAPVQNLHVQPATTCIQSSACRSKCVHECKPAANRLQANVTNSSQNGKTGGTD